MLGTSISAIHTGLVPEVIRVEADVSGGFPRFSIVGLPDSAITESKLRIRSAFRNCGLPFPQGRITVNLTPANFRKRGSGLDLAMAIAILRAAAILPADDGTTAFLGELRLSGELAPVETAISLALRLQAAKVDRLVLAKRQVVPPELATDMQTIPAVTLTDVISIMTTSTPVNHVPPSDSVPPHDTKHGTDLQPGLVALDGIRGKTAEKRLLAISAAGRLPLLFIGPPGIGKTLLATHLVDLFPDLDARTALATLAIRELTGPGGHLNRRPPLRMPHHSLTVAGLIGGGNPPQPGEVTLASEGVLLLDELFEFQRATLDALREPLTHHEVHLSRAGRSTTLPANFLLVATANPCPCGQRGYGECRCMESDVRRYWSRLSGPLADRIPLIVYLNRQPPIPLQPALDVSAQTLQTRVQHAREQLEHSEEETPSTRPLPRWLDDAAAAFLKRVNERILTSERARQQALRIARTISALEGRETVLKVDIEEAVLLRSHAHM
ncbi:magnesium chelatase [Alicyclobacillus acidoterrestris]|nr:magnesium chelatase [Alicyclobacillus acidoterrestris]